MVIPYFKLGCPVGSAISVLLRLLRRCGHSELVQLLRAQDLGQGPPWEEGVFAQRAARPQGRSPLSPFAAGSLAQEETQVRKRLSWEALPLCVPCPGGRGPLSHSGAESLPSEGQEQPQKADEGFVIRGPQDPGLFTTGNTSSCLSSCECKCTNIWSPLASVQMSSPSVWTTGLC